MFVDARCSVSSMEYFPNSKATVAGSDAKQRSEEGHVPCFLSHLEAKLDFGGATRHVQTRSCSMK